MQIFFISWCLWKIFKQPQLLLYKWDCRGWLLRVMKIALNFLLSLFLAFLSASCSSADAGSYARVVRASQQDSGRFGRVLRSRPFLGRVEQIISRPYYLGRGGTGVGQGRNVMEAYPEEYQRGRRYENENKQQVIIHGGKPIWGMFQ